MFNHPNISVSIQSLLRNVRRFAFSQGGILSGPRLIPFFLNFHEGLARLQCFAFKRRMICSVTRGSEQGSGLTLGVQEKSDFSNSFLHCSWSTAASS